LRYHSFFVVNLYYYFLKTMKFYAVCFGLLLSVASVTRVSAQIVTVTYDSLPIDSLITAPPNNSADSIEGGPDQRQARMGDADFFAVQFTDDNQPGLFQKGAIMQIYWSRAASDSCAIAIQFMNYSYSGPPRIDDSVYEIFEGGPENVWHMTPITVPDTGFNALQIGVDVNPNAGHAGADSCFIDAIVLVQKDSVTAGVAHTIGTQQPVLMNYPNPFYHTSGTHIQIHEPVAGIGMLSVTDALGREVARVPLGSVNTGDQDVSLALDRAGIFFVRLYMDGSPVGSPLEISGE
jgi:hypothetical protein